jgi:hypothetical protein
MRIIELLAFFMAAKPLLKALKSNRFSIRDMDAF